MMQADAPRGLDHVVHAVRDLDAAGEIYRRLGFLVGARNRHPWGTHNRNIQLPEFYVELLTVAEPEKLGSEGFSVLFGGFTRTFLEQQEGLSMLLLGSPDAASAAAEFRASGIAASDALNFEREGKRPDGSPVTVGFSVAFASDATAPEIGYGVCQHHHPQNFWNPAFQVHPNTASAVAGLIMVAEKPEQHTGFLSAYLGTDDLKGTAQAIVVETPRGDFEVMDPRRYSTHFGTSPPDVSRGPRLAALRFFARDLAATAAALRSNGIATAAQGGRLVVGPDTACGATLVFEVSAC